MNQTNKDQDQQLAVINQQTVSLFKKSLNEKDLTNQIIQGKARVSWIHGNETIYSLPNSYSEHMETIIGLTEHGGWYEREVQNIIRLLADFSYQFESDLKKEMANEFQLIVNSQQNGYNRFFNAIQQEFQEKINDLELSIETDQDYLQKNQQEIAQLKRKLASLQNKLAEYRDRFKNSDWSEIIRNKRHSIQSNEDFLSKSLIDLNAKLHDLSTENLSKDDIILQLQEKLNNYSLFIKYCESFITKLKNETKLQENLLMDSNNNQLAQEAEIIRLNSIIDVMQIDLDGLEQEKASAIKAFNNYKVKIEEERLEHKRSEAENLQLDKEVASLKFDKEKLQKTIDELGESIDLWQAKSRKTALNFNFERNNLLEQLKTTNNLAFASKVEMMTLLAIDTTRNFVSYGVGDWITYGETALFASEITGWKTNACWTGFGLFCLSVWIMGGISLYYKAKSGIWWLLSKFPRKTPTEDAIDIPEVKVDKLISKKK